MPLREESTTIHLLANCRPTYPLLSTFGRNGKPFYTSGPRDNPHQVIATLQRTVGAPPNFDYIVAQPL
jgi:hypothetical protein